MHITINRWVLIISMMVLLACNLPFIHIGTQSPVRASTIPIFTDVVQTTLPSPTGFVQQSNTPTGQPSYTPLPSETSLSATPYVTANPATPTSTPIPYPCDVISVSPPLGIFFDPRWDFDAVWEVKNTGSSTWDQDHVVYAYASGTEMYKFKSEYKLAADLNPGGIITIRVDMLAPAEPGRFTTTWVIRDNSYLLCAMSITIRVAQ